MNHAQALKALRHARTGMLLSKKKVGNATWLHRVVDASIREHPPEDRHEVYLSLFDKSIMYWKNNGDIQLTCAGYWTPTTKDRFNKFLPRGFNVWQDRPYWFIKTPLGVRPFRDSIELRPDGYDSGLCMKLNQLDARQLREEARQYGMMYFRMLANGLIAESYQCSICKEIELETPRNGHVVGDGQAHLLQHVLDKTYPASLIWAAVNRIDDHARCFAEFRDSPRVGRAFLRDVIYASWTESQKAWRPAKTKKALIEKTELLIVDENVPRLDLRPRKFRRHLCTLVEDFLLDSFGFEWMPD